MRPLPKCVVVPASDPRTVRTAIRFPFGLPGFENERRFEMIEHSPLAPLVLLQSEATAGLCFLTLPLAAVAPDYDLAVGEDACQALGLDPAEAAAAGLLALVIVTVPEQGPATVNLMAPVVVNLAAGIGVQMVRQDQRYSHRHPLGDPLCW